MLFITFLVAILSKGSNLLAVSALVCLKSSMTSANFLESSLVRFLVNF